MSENRKSRVWINTRVILEWNGEKYIETYAEGYWYEGALARLHNNPSTDQEIYRWRDDDGTDETDGTWLAAANTTYEFDLSSGNVDARIRFSVAENGGGDETSQTYPLEFQINTGGYNTITASTTGCIYYDSSKLTNGNDTTEQLAGPGTFQSTNGGQCEDGVVDAFVLTASSDVEFEYTVRFVAADLSNGDSIDFRVAGLDAYTVTGNATISKLTNYSLVCDSGSYSVSGTAANPEKHYVVTGVSGSYSVSGTDVALNKGYPITAESGSYSVNGTAASLIEGYLLATDSGTYTVTGTDTILRAPAVTRLSQIAIGSDNYRTFEAKAPAVTNYTIVADSGSYSVAGTDASLIEGYNLFVDSGVYSKSGTDAGLLYNYVITATSGSYSVTGTAVTLTYSAVSSDVAASYGDSELKKQRLQQQYEDAYLSALKINEQGEPERDIDADVRARRKKAIAMLLENI